MIDKVRHLITIGDDSVSRSFYVSENGTLYMSKSGDDIFHEEEEWRTCTKEEIIVYTCTECTCLSEDEIVSLYDAGVLLDVVKFWKGNQKPKFDEKFFVR